MATSSKSFLGAISQLGEVNSLENVRKKMDIQRGVQLESFTEGKHLKLIL